jgi:hypothetical protein
MNVIFKRFLKFTVIVMIIGYIGCASVPKEVVELSYTVGDDLNAVHVSYRQLVKDYFGNLRKQVEDFMDNRWTPGYLKRFIDKTGLSQKVQDFTPEQVLVYLQKWVQVAMNQIQKKKNELLAPINNDEKELLADVDESFARLTYANAVITGNLNSIRKIKEVEDQVLSALHLKGLRDKITDGMAKASKKTKTAIELLEKGEEMVDSIDEQKKEIVKKAEELVTDKKEGEKK